MTGEKNRGTTHEKLWKLDDKYLKTPKHDELVLQLLSKKNSSEVLNKLGYGKRLVVGKYLEYSENCIGNMTWGYVPFSEKDILDNISARVEKKKRYNEEYVNDTLGIGLSKLSQPIADFKNKLDRDANSAMESEEIQVVPDSIRSEVPIVNGNNRFIIGYIDVQLQVTSYRNTRTAQNTFEYDFDVEVVERTYSGKDGYKYENPKTTNISGSITKAIGLVSFIPKAVNEEDAARGNRNPDFNINIEVKPVIDSFGETLRQINTYREYLPHDTFIIYSPDARFKEAFETQGIPLITPADIGL